jgi:chemotaxis protein CheC
MDELQHDVLKEIANIGAGHAASALSALLNRPIVQSVPEIEPVPISKLQDVIGNAEKVVVGGMVDIDGDFSGYLMMLLDFVQAERIVSLVLGKPMRKTEKLHRFSTMDKSVLSETLNILGGSYLTAIAEFTNLKVIQSIPYLSIDMAGAVLNVVIAEAGKTGDYALLFNSELYNDDEKLFGNLFLVPRDDSCKILLQSLGIV